MQDGKYVILCIDDDPDYLFALKSVLEDGGYVYLSAPSAETGLKIYKDHHPDLVIVDLMMEEVDAGIGFVKDLQAMGNTAPVYMLSSVGDSLNVAADYSSLGLAGVFQKPTDNEKLLSVLAAKLR